MPKVFTQSYLIAADVIDVNKHVSNLAYLQWMQEAAIAHSAAAGWPLTRYLEARAAWIVRSHFIEYLLPAFLGNTLTLLTWVTGYKKHSSPRRYLFWRRHDDQVVARAETVWVFVDASTGRLATIPAELRAAFPVVPPGEDVLRLVRLGLEEQVPRDDQP